MWVDADRSILINRPVPSGGSSENFKWWLMSSSRARFPKSVSCIHRVCAKMSFRISTFQNTSKPMFRDTEICSNVLRKSERCSINAQWDRNTLIWLTWYVHVKSIICWIFVWAHFFKSRMCLTHGVVDLLNIRLIYSPDRKITRLFHIYCIFAWNIRDLMLALPCR